MAEPAAKKAPPRKAAEKRAAKKTSPAKASAQKTSPAKTASTKAAAKKTAPARAKKASARAQPPPHRDVDRGSSRVARAAREAVLELTGKSPEAVTGLRRSDEGWTVEVEVLELERIPSTTDVLATYEVTLDQDGGLEGCQRVHRYLRGSPGDR